MGRLFQNRGLDGKCAYIYPSQEVARAVYKHIEGEVGPAFGVSVALLQGELGADLKLLAANIIVSSATHWDMVSRRWKQRKHIQNVDLYIADELHLLGARDGPVFEVVLSRARYVASQLERPCRIVGLSALVTNAKDIGDWLGVPQKAFFNFAGAGIQQVPLEVSLFGFDNNYANARLLGMSKYAYNACTKVAPEKPCVVFLPSRKQTLLSAIDFVTFAASVGQPFRFRVKGFSALLEESAMKVQEEALAQVLQRCCIPPPRTYAERQETRGEPLCKRCCVSVALSLQLLLGATWQVPNLYYHGYRAVRWQRAPLCGLFDGRLIADGGVCMQATGGHECEVHSPVPYAQEGVSQAYSARITTNRESPRPRHATICVRR